RLIPKLSTPSIQGLGLSLMGQSQSVKPFILNDAPPPKEAPKPPKEDTKPATKEEAKPAVMLATLDGSMGGVGDLRWVVCIVGDLHGWYSKIYDLGLLILWAYASSMPLIISLPLSMECDDSDGRTRMLILPFLDALLMLPCISLRLLWFVIMIKGTKTSSAVSIILKGANDFMLDEMDRSMDIEL
ncbi:hypothetical protein Tco_1409749, partial [Tanacetum coccineum]